MTSSTWEWVGTAGSANVSSNWQILTGPGNGYGLPEPGDTIIAVAGTLSFPIDAQLSSNTIELGNPLGTATLVFTGDTAITGAEPTIDANSVVTSAFQSVGTFTAPTTAVAAEIDAQGVFVNAGTIAATGLPGSSFTIANYATTINGTTQPGYFLNTGQIYVGAANSMTITVGNGSELVNSGEIVVNGGTLNFDAATGAVAGGYAPAAGTIVIEGGGTVETDAAYAANVIGVEPIYEFADAISGNTLHIDDLNGSSAFGGAILGFGSGDTIDLGSSLAIGKIVYSQTTGILNLESSGGAILASLDFASGNFQSGTFTASGGVAGSFTIGTGGDGDTVLTTNVANDYYDNGGGTWQNAGGWSNGTPVTQGTAFIGAGATNAFTLTTGSVTVTVGALVLAGDGTLLQVTSNVQVSPYLIEQSAGTLEVTGGNSLTATGAAMTGGMAEVDPGGALDLSGHPGLATIGDINGTLTASGTIALELGNSASVVVNDGAMTASGAVFDAGLIAISNDGTATITGAVTGSGTISLASGAALSLGSTATGGTIDFAAGAHAELVLGDDTGFHDTVSGLGVGSGGAKTDFIDITGHTVSISSVSGQGTTDGTITLSDGAVLDLTNLSSSNWFADSVGDGDGGTDVFVSNTDITLPCYVRGTQIRTAAGDVAVEHLKIGDAVITASGALRPVRWLGSRAIDCSGYADPASVWPICIRAGAFAEHQPVRDLWVSLGHAVFIDGVLIQAGKLVNGVTIMQLPRERVEYWHVELDAHDVILAEGLPAESYLDTGNRTAFVNGGEYLEARPDFAPKHWTETCVPLALEGPALQQAKAALLARAQALGHEVTQDADLHVLADGKRIDPVRLGDARHVRWAFMLPANSRLELRSRTFIPAHVDAHSGDTRSLGLCVRRLQLDGSDVALDDGRLFEQGWHKLECNSQGCGRRWTKSSVPLPAGTRLVVIDLVSHGYYWAMPSVRIADCG